MFFKKKNPSKQEVAAASDAPILVFTSISLGEIALVKSMLKSADIDFHIENELTIGYGQIISQCPAAGGMKIFVRPDDVDDAREIIKALDED